MAVGAQPLRPYSYSKEILESLLTQTFSGLEFRQFFQKVLSSEILQKREVRD
jgi:hypothetical protein